MMRRARTRKSARDEKRSCCSASGTGSAGFGGVVGVAVAVTAADVEDVEEEADDEAAATAAAAAIVSTTALVSMLIAILLVGHYALVLPSLTGPRRMFGLKCQSQELVIEDLC